VQIKNEVVEEKKSSFRSGKTTWEHEVVWFLIDDINNATNFLETMKERLHTSKSQELQAI